MKTLKTLPVVIVDVSVARETANYTLENHKLGVPRLKPSVRITLIVYCVFTRETE